MRQKCEKDSKKGSKVGWQRKDNSQKTEGEHEEKEADKEKDDERRTEEHDGRSKK